MLSCLDRPQVIVDVPDSWQRLFWTNIEIPGVRGTLEIHTDRYKSWKGHNPNPGNLPIYKLIGHNLIDYMEEYYLIKIRSLAFGRYFISVVLEDDSVSEKNWDSLDKSVRFTLASLVNVVDARKIEKSSTLRYSLLNHGEVLSKIVPEERRLLLPKSPFNKRDFFPAKYYLPLNDESENRIKQYGNEYCSFVNRIGQITGIQILSISDRCIDLIPGEFFLKDSSYVNEVNNEMLQIFRKYTKNVFFNKEDLFSLLNPWL